MSHGYEPTDAKAKPLIIFTVILAVFTVTSFFAGLGIYRILEKGRLMLDPPLHPMAVERKIADGQPRLQVREAVDLAEHRRLENKKVQSYGWISREASVVRVPLDKAMDLVLEKNELKSRE